MKSFYEFYSMMEEDGTIPPPPSSNVQGVNPAGSSPSTMSAPTVPPSGATSPPVPDPKTQMKDDLKTSLHNFITQKFEPFVSKQKLNPMAAKEFMSVLIGEILDEFNLTKSQVMQAAKSAVTPNQGNETKTPPQAPTAAS